MRRSITVFSVLVVACMVVLQAQAQAPGSHPIIGTWKLNVERSSFDPGPGPRSSVRMFVEGEDGFVIATRITENAQGNPAFSRGYLKFDGKDYDFHSDATLTDFLASGTPTPLTAAFRVINANTMQLIQKNNGQAGNVETIWSVSTDGKTLTTTGKGTNAQGQSVNDVAVFERVQ